MGELRIELEGSGAWARPGGEVTGRLRWEAGEAPGEIEVRLLWYTEGRGSRDVGVVERRVFEAAAPAGELAFRLPVPEGPYSFQGRLITLRWVVEAEARGGGMLVQEPLVVGPTPVPVDLTVPPGGTG